MDSPSLGHLTELPPPLRYPLAAWFAQDRRSIWALTDGLAACPSCSTMRAVFQIERRKGQVQARCINCARPEHDADAPATAISAHD